MIDPCCLTAPSEPDVCLAGVGYGPEVRETEAAEEISSGEDEDRMPKPKLGAGHWGHGPPLVSRLMGKRKPFSDGFGLCSPGRWPPAMRRTSADTPALALMEALGVELEKNLRQTCDIRKLAMQLATGKLTECPFDAATIDKGRELIFVTLEIAGTKLPVRERTEHQPFFLAAMEELLRLSGDPDHRVYFTASQSFAKGVRLGVGAKLPRVPAVFERKQKWRTYADENSGTGIRDNYISAEQHADVVQEQFQQEAQLGAMTEMSLVEARRCFPNLCVASLGAIEEKDGSYRVIHDGTHGIDVNSKIVVRDQLRNPTGRGLADIAGNSARCLLRIVW